MSRSFGDMRRASIIDMGVIHGATVESGLEQTEEGYQRLQGYIAAAEPGSEVDDRQDPQGLDEEGGESGSG